MRGWEKYVHVGDNRNPTKIYLKQKGNLSIPRIFRDAFDFKQGEVFTRSNDVMIGSFAILWL